MKAFVAVAVALPALASFAGVPSWRQVDSGTTETLWGVATLDESTAVAVGANGTILRSEDRGETWAPQESGTERFLTAVAFGDSLHGAAVGVGGVILRTEDGGFTWTAQYSGTTQLLYGVHFADALTGAAVGGNVVTRTNDGGKTWREQRIPPPPYQAYEFRSVFFTDAMHGTIVGYSYPHSAVSAILTTRDGGATWKRARAPTEPPLYGVAFSDSLRGTAVGGGGISGGGGVVMRTVDGGATWYLQLHVDNGLFMSVAFAGDVGVTLGTFWTWDGGESWTEGRGGLSRVAFFDADRAISVGGLGGIALSEPPSD